MVSAEAVPTAALEAAWEIAAAVPDPELPVVTIGELGILRDVRRRGDTTVVTITPTYSGCPALREITEDVRRRMRAAGISNLDIEVALHPAWTTDWISAEGRRKLHAAGIAPPAPARPARGVPVTLLPRPLRVACPRCGSSDTELLSAFSATACTAAHRCRVCREPFDRFKEL
jgi:ring-1,2-phenylacetyl-CoA epoxidase subunit PaaD